MFIALAGPLMALNVSGKKKYSHQRDPYLMWLSKFAKPFLTRVYMKLLEKSMILVYLVVLRTVYAIILRKTL